MSALTIALAGALGALSRYGLGLLSQRLLPPGGALLGLPLSTLLVNVVGSFLLGLLTGMTLVGTRIPLAWRPALTTGFLGSFTTFSTFSVETVGLVERGEWRLALLNIGLQLLVGLGAAVGGLAAGRALG